VAGSLRNLFWKSGFSCYLFPLQHSNLSYTELDAVEALLPCFFALAPLFCDLLNWQRVSYSTTVIKTESGRRIASAMQTLDVDASQGLFLAGDGALLISYQADLAKKMRLKQTMLQAHMLTL
jgi:hypothetical protein